MECAADFGFPKSAFVSRKCALHINTYKETLHNEICKILSEEAEILYFGY